MICKHKHALALSCSLVELHNNTSGGLETGSSISTDSERVMLYHVVIALPEA